MQEEPTPEGGAVKSGAEKPGAEKSGAERILEAAVGLFGEHGVKATSLKVIATEAGVSQALIVHHFGTKDGLRRSCDAHVARLLRASKEASIDHGPQMDPLAALRMIENGRPILRYLVRTLSEGGDHVDEFIDEMVADAESYMARGVDQGIFKPSTVPRERVVLLVLWSLGSLVLHEHMHRLLGVDMLAHDPGPESLAPYMRPAMELFTQGLMEEGAYEQLARLFDAPGAPGAPDAPDSPENQSDQEE